MERKDYAALWRKFATLLGSGVPLVPSLVTLQLEHAGTPLGQALADVVERVKSGERFSEALAAYPDLFPRDVVQILRGGERQGRLDEVAKTVGEELDRGVLSCPGDPGSTAAPTSAEAGEAAEPLGGSPLGDLLTRALAGDATDVHLDPAVGGGTVRFRRDGVLEQTATLDAATYRRALANVKALASLDVGETRLPQDGRARIKLGTEQLDVRVGVGPCVLGEAAVLRLLRERPLQRVLDHPELVFPEAGLRETLGQLTALPHGLFICTGPSGSGKTTSVYSLLSRRDARRSWVASVEDPVEVALPGVHQIQVRPQLGLTFPAALRHLMRMDPDVIYCGEVRDVETAAVLLRVALTGHFVFTQFHAPSALGCLQRLLDMGLEPYLVADAVVGILSQRLVRTLCPACRVPAPGHLPRVAALAGGPLPEGAAAFEPVGCPACSGSGYKGRRALYELLPMSPALKSALRAAPPPGALDRAARGAGFTPMAGNAAALVLAGDTSLTEVLRVLPSAVAGADV